MSNPPDAPRLPSAAHASGKAARTEHFRAWLSVRAGRLATMPASRWLIPCFARHYRIRREQALVPEGGYANLQQFFCRALRPELRPIRPDPGMLLSPADGVLTACGRIHDQQQVEAKNHAYTIAELLADAGRALAFLSGWFAVIYLAPADYHRVHAPAAGLVREARYVPGTHFSVNPKTAARVPNLLASNERLITYFDTQAGELAVVMVGACLVGGIRVNYDPPWNSGPGPHLADRRRYDPASGFERGQEFGRFEFGSTVVVLAPPAAASQLCAETGARVRYGEPLMRGAESAQIPPPAGY